MYTLNSTTAPRAREWKGVLMPAIRSTAQTNCGVAVAVAVVAVTLIEDGEPAALVLWRPHG